MRIALIAPPFVTVPPKKYGGTELFIAQLAEGLQNLAYEVAAAANAEEDSGNADDITNRAAAWEPLAKLVFTI
jgi:hypothetical protein